MLLTRVSSEKEKSFEQLIVAAITLMVFATFSHFAFSRNFAKKFAKRERIFSRKVSFAGNPIINPVPVGVEGVGVGKIIQ